MTNAALIEQIKDDLGYLKLHRSAEVFATLAEAARRESRRHSSSSPPWWPRR